MTKKITHTLHDGDHEVFAILSFDEAAVAICKIVVANPETLNGNNDIVELDEGEFLELFESMADLVRRFGRDPYEYLAPAEDDG